MRIDNIGGLTTRLTGGTDGAGGGNGPIVILLHGSARQAMTWCRWRMS